MERKAMCYRLSTIAVTLRSGSSPQLLRVLEASLSFLEVMTGRPPVQLHLLPSFSVNCAGHVVVNLSGAWTEAMSVEKDAQIAICWHVGSFSVQGAASA